MTPHNHNAPRTALSRPPWRSSVLTVRPHAVVSLEQSTPLTGSHRLAPGPPIATFLLQLAPPACCARDFLPPPSSLSAGLLTLGARSARDTDADGSRAGALACRISIHSLTPGAALRGRILSGVGGLVALNAMHTRAYVALTASSCHVVVRAHRIVLRRNFHPLGWTGSTHHHLIRVQAVHLGCLDIAAALITWASQPLGSGAEGFSV